MANKPNLFKTVKGQRVQMTSREVKAYIMKVNNWTAEQYKKQYDIFKNKLRAFEAYEASTGAKVTQQSAVELLYKEARSKASYGSNYTPSIKMQRIRSFTSVSSGKAGQKALQSTKYRERRAKAYGDATFKQFEGLIRSNQTASNIYYNIKDPVKREKALTDFANQMHAKIDAQGRATANEAIPSGETIGSDTADITFDISKYL